MDHLADPNVLIRSIKRDEPTGNIGMAEWKGVARQLIVVSGP